MINTDRSIFIECAQTIEAEIKAQSRSNNKEEKGYICLRDAIRTLDSAGLEKKGLIKTGGKTEERS